MESDVEAIAAKLSKAQRALILALPGGGEWVLSAGLLESFPPNSFRGFGKQGLVDGYYHDPMRHRLTPLGLAVRTALLSQTKE